MLSGKQKTPAEASGSSRWTRFGARERTVGNAARITTRQARRALTSVWTARIAHLATFTSADWVWNGTASFSAHTGNTLPIVVAGFAGFFAQ